MEEDKSISEQSQEISAALYVPKSNHLCDFKFSSTESLVVVQNIPGPYRDPAQEDAAVSSSSTDTEDEGDAEVKALRPYHHFVPKPDQPILVDPNYIPSVPQAPLARINMLKLGRVTAVYDGVVVIKSLPKLPALDSQSALYFKDRRPMGFVYDIFGPVNQPMYVVVYENRNAKPMEGGGKPPKINLEVKVGDEIYCAEDESLSIKILTDEIARIKACDDGDSHEEFYSNDEEEKKAKREIRAMKKRCKKRDGTRNPPPAAAPQARRPSQQWRPPQQQRPQHQHHQQHWQQQQQVQQVPNFVQFGGQPRYGAIPTMFAQPHLGVYQAPPQPQPTMDNINMVPVEFQVPPPVIPIPVNPQFNFNPGYMAPPPQHYQAYVQNPPQGRPPNPQYQQRGNRPS